jgi:CelD/BcsL family acetyltransferase involved in cellulose biosynthesis
VKVEVITPSEISGTDRQRWLTLQRSNPHLHSPYFHPEFSACVGSVRPNARVAVVEQDGARAFFPFQHSRLGVSGPIGGGLSDYQAVIASQHTRFDPRELLEQCGLAIWEFDHLVAAQKPFRPFHRTLAGSPFLDLSNGFEAYVRARRDAGAKRVLELIRKTRKLEREVGGVEFVAHRADHGLLDLVIEWKSRQCRRTGVLDYFSELDWTVPLVRRILETNTDGFSGMLSVLYVRGRIVAAHLGMRSERSLHYWFPVFEPDGEFAKFSPGSILLLKLAEHAAQSGISVLDLGKGDESYKTSFMTGTVQIAEGAVDTESWPATLWHVRQRSRQWLRRTPALASIRESIRAYRQMRRRSSST